MIQMKISILSEKRNISSSLGYQVDCMGQKEIKLRLKEWIRFGYEANTSLKAKRIYACIQIHSHIHISQFYLLKRSRSSDNLVAMSTHSTHRTLFLDLGFILQ